MGGDSIFTSFYFLVAATALIFFGLVLAGIFFYLRTRTSVDLKLDPKVFNEYRDGYIEILKPVFLPDDPVSDDIVRYFASLLRVLGMEDKGWDPYEESRGILKDINSLMQIKLPEHKFADPDRTTWRLGLLLYAHIVEMNAPYDVLTNLLRFKLKKGYSPNPYFDLLTEKEKKNFARFGIRTSRKIEIIKNLSREAGSKVGDIFDEYYRINLRNAIQHSDFILTDEDFRSRTGISGSKAFKIPYDELNTLLTKSKAFIAAFFQVESLARQVWGLEKGKAIPYDLRYKGLMEILVDDQDLMCGFAVHWPNNSQSIYRRTKEGIDMSNCMIDLKHGNLRLWVDQYAQNPGDFSPLVESDGTPIYTPLDKSDIRPTWPDKL